MKIDVLPIHLLTQVNPSGFLRLTGSRHFYRGPAVEIPITKMDTVPISWSDDDIMDYSETRIIIRLKKLNRAVNQMDLINLQSNGEQANYLDALGIPSYAEMNVDLAQDRKIFTWEVGAVDYDIYDILFDLDAYEPVHNRDDNDWRAQGVHL